jgi:predicted DNA-binding protein with PD1-like motif
MQSRKLPSGKQEVDKVEKSREENLLLVRLSDGDDLEDALKKALAEEKIDSGVVIGGVGMVRDAALSFYVGKGEYETIPIHQAAELCALSGNVSTMGGETVIHLHATVATRGGTAVAGHFSGGKVNMTAEIAIMATPQKLKRESDPKTGLRLLRFE